LRYKQRELYNGIGGEIVMARTILMMVSAFVIGAGGGALLVQWYVAPRLADSAARCAALERETAAIREQRERLAKEAARLEEENQDYVGRISDLESQLAALKAGDQAGAKSSAPDAALELSGIEVADSLLSELFRPRPDSDDGATSERPRGREDGRPPEQRRQEMAARMRDMVQGYLAVEAANTTDASAQERLQSLADYADLMLDIRQRLRAATTPEEEEAVREEMRAAVGEIEQLVQEQQRYLLRQAAANAGIDRNEQERLVTEIQNTLQSPFFHLDRQMLRGADRGPWRGGRGRRE